MVTTLPTSTNFIACSPNEIASRHCRNDPVWDLDGDGAPLQGRARAGLRRPAAADIFIGFPAGEVDAWDRRQFFCDEVPLRTAQRRCSASGFLIARRNCWMAVFHFASICAVAAAICAGVPPAPSGEVDAGHADTATACRQNWRDRPETMSMPCLPIRRMQRPLWRRPSVSSRPRSIHCGSRMSHADADHPHFAHRRCTETC